jgi:hypothetical protein
MTTETTQWLLESDEPWTRYRTMVNLLDLPEGSPDVMSVRKEMIEHPQIQELIEAANTWPGYPLKRHNDAKHPIYKFSTLADFGVKDNDPGMATAVASIMNHQSKDGPYQIIVNIPKAFGGTGEDQWTWILCDSPTLLYALLSLGKGDDPGVGVAVDYLVSLVDENGFRCKADPALGKFKGPGRREHPCPIANVYALKALSQVPEQVDSLASQKAAEMLLTHWELRGERKYYLFGIGTDFRKLKYPFVWYDILHLVEVLSRYPFACNDPRFKEMVKIITDQADEDGRYTAGSMYMAWKGWSFADKKEPSPWLTFLVKRVEKRLSNY